MGALRLQDYALVLDPRDDVGVMRRAVGAGVHLVGGGVDLVTDRAIGVGHKVAIRPIAEGAGIRKYGQVIGFAKEPITAGEHVHVHNVVVKDFLREYAYCADVPVVDYVPEDRRRTFAGYLRADGKVGTRNYVAVISSVNCSASVSKYVADRFRTPEFRREYPNVDGVVAFAHKLGCGIQPGEPHEILQRVAAGLARHANVFGYVMIGLGCEVNQVQFIRAAHQLDVVSAGAPEPTFMNIQAVGGVRRTVEAAAEAVRKLLPMANAARRTAQPVSHLVLATNCGGSDGNSGITANPALGVAADELVRHGGTAVLGETPEIYGAEHLMVRRAVSRDVAERLIERIKWWEQYAKANGGTIDNNPSWGNKEGGLTTIYEKSLGAVSKGGQSPLAAVYRYAEQIVAKGFCIMDTPGYDPVSMTGLVTGGCNVGVFTTGRGSVYGCKPSPCIKLTTNSDVFERMNEDMDLNAGTILEGKETVREVGMRVFEKIVAVASGEKTKSEEAGIGDEEFAPWMLGAQF